MKINMDSKEETKQPSECTNHSKSVLRSSLDFIENETGKAVSLVEKGVETVMYPFERCIDFIRHEFDLMKKSKLIIKEACDIVSNICNMFNEEPNLNCFIGLLFWIGYCYIFEIWMIPLLVPYIFLRQYILKNFQYFMFDCNETEAEKKSEEESISEMLQALCDVCDKIDNGIEATASIIKTTKRILNLEEPEVCYLAVILSAVTSVILYYISLRYIIIFGSIYLFSKNYLEFNGYLQN